MFQEQETGAKKKKKKSAILSLLFPRTLFSLVSFCNDTLLSVSITPYFIYQKQFLNIHPVYSMRSPSSFCSLAGAIIAGIVKQRDTDCCVRMGLLAARLSLVSQHPIAPTLTLDSVDPSQLQPQNWPKPKLMLMD